MRPKTQVKFDKIKEMIGKGGTLADALKATGMAGKTWQKYKAFEAAHMARKTRLANHFTKAKQTIEVPASNHICILMGDAAQIQQILDRVAQ